MSKKKIKINFLDFWPDLDKENNIFTDILKKHFEVEISDEPDFLFVTYMTAARTPYLYTEYDCVRILVSWDALYPDLNVFDYAITNFNVQCNDRCLWFPVGFATLDRNDVVSHRHNRIPADLLATKTEFCDFIYSRGQYKKLLSVGSYRNNMEDGARVTMAEKSKYQHKCKFTIAFEGMSEPGFISEKIMDAFAANTIPVYVGHKETVDRVFNPNSYINVADYDWDMERVLQEVIRLDNDDEAYLSKLPEPVLLDENYLVSMHDKLEQFLVNICSQDVEKAYRRLKYYQPKTHEMQLNRYYRFRTRYKPLYWAVVVLEKLRDRFIGKK